MSHENQRFTAESREAAYRRVRRLTAVSAAGSISVAAALGLVAHATLPGKANTVSTVSARPASASPSPAGSSGSIAAPTPSPTPAVTAPSGSGSAVTGGSGA